MTPLLVCRFFPVAFSRLWFPTLCNKLFQACWKISADPCLTRGARQVYLWEVAGYGSFGWCLFPELGWYMLLGFQVQFGTESRIPEGQMTLASRNGLFSEYGLWCSFSWRQPRTRKLICLNLGGTQRILFLSLQLLWGGLRAPPHWVSAAMRRSSVQMPALLLMLTAPTPVRRRASPWLLVAVALVCLVLYSLYNSLQLASRESERCAHRAFVSRLGVRSTTSAAVSSLNNDLLHSLTFGLQQRL